jgi:hypothetical protein
MDSALHQRVDDVRQDGFSGYRDQGFRLGVRVRPEH